MEDGSVDSKTGLKGIFSRKEAWLSYVSISLFVSIPSCKTKIIFLIAKTL